MTCGQKLIGFLLVSFNVLLFLFGLALAAVGVWTVVDKVYVGTVISDDLFQAASYLAIIVGVILLAVSVLGICSVRLEQRLIVVVYFVCLLVIFLALLLSAILAVVFKSELENEMKDKMQQTLLTGYGEDQDITSAWNRLQQELECCGVQANTGIGADMELTRQDSWLLYQRTLWYKQARQMDLKPVEFVPSSCCRTDEKLNFRPVDLQRCQTWMLGPPGNLKTRFANDALHYDGCYEKAQQFVGDQADILVGCAFAFAFSVVSGLVLTVLLYRGLGQRTQDLHKEQS